MPLLERLLALRFGWIMIRLGVALCLVLSSVSPNTAGILNEDSDSSLEDSKVEPEKESLGELAQESIVAPPPLFQGPPSVVRLGARLTRDHRTTTRRRLANRARAPPAR